MASKFWALAFISLVLIGSASAQPFGRFGYGKTPFHDLVKFRNDGIESDGSEFLSFATPLEDRKVFKSSNMEQTVGFKVAADCPSKFKVSLTAPGFSMFADGKLTLGSTAIGAPYLTWSEGSVRQDVPTPAVSWVVLSFSPKQPAYIFGFPDAPGAMTIKGKPGNWSIELAPRKGWIRVGRVPAVVGTNSAASLGQLKLAAQKLSWLFVQPAPTLLQTKVTANNNSIQSNWVFDRPGAILPAPLFLARLDGLNVRVLSKSERISTTGPLGPVEVLIGKELIVQFPLKRIPTGRPVAIGSPTTSPPGTVSPLDLPSIAELAFEAIPASRDPEVVKTAESAYAEFLSQVNFAAEPSTQTQLPFLESGQGADLASAHALLTQILVSAKRASSEENSLFTGLIWGQDWLTWKFSSPDEAINRRVGAFAAITGAFCPEPERRLSAAMFETGLAADRGFLRWKNRQQVSPAVRTIIPDLVEPMWNVRKTIYGYTKTPGPIEPADPFVMLLRSPIRVYADPAFVMAKDESGLVCTWSALQLRNQGLAFASSAPINFRAVQNLSELTTTSALGIAEVRFTPETTGACTAKLDWPTWAPEIPAWAPPPRYSETPRPLDLR